MVNIINKNLIKLNVEGIEKKEIIKELANLIYKENRLNDFEKYVESVLEREESITTGIGFGIAIPHGKCKAVDVPTVAFGRVVSGVEWKSLDDHPVHVIFLLAVPEEAGSNQHLKILAALSRKLMDESFVANLLNIEDEDALLELLSKTFEKALL